MKVPTLDIRFAKQTTRPGTGHDEAAPNKRLLSLAERMQLTTREEAAGHCLSVSLDFALAARQFYGEESRLIKWTVVGDPHYVDHWAVLLDDERVLDMTHVQVDGRRRLVSRIDSYPSNFCNARVYPAELLTGAYMESQGHETGRFTNRFIWTCGARLFRHDVTAALAAHHLHGLRVALGEGWRFLRLFLLGCMRRWLERRARQLVSRLHERADPARGAKQVEHHAEQAVTKRASFRTTAFG